MDNPVHSAGHFKVTEGTICEFTVPYRIMVIRKQMQKCKQNNYYGCLVPRCMFPGGEFL